jgi:hypothetical protein
VYCSAVICLLQIELQEELDELAIQVAAQSSAHEQVSSCTCCNHISVCETSHTPVHVLNNLKAVEEAASALRKKFAAPHPPPSRIENMSHFAQVL